MDEHAHYPPPDFSRPPPNSIQPLQQPPARSSSFHPSMWNWCDTSFEPSWSYRGQAAWHHGAEAGCGYAPGGVNYGLQRPYGEGVGGKVVVGCVTYSAASNCNVAPRSKLWSWMASRRRTKIWRTWQPRKKGQIIKYQAFYSFVVKRGM